MDDEIIENELNLIKDFLAEFYGSLSLISKYNEDKPAFRQNVNDTIDAMQRDNAISEYVGQNVYLDEDSIQYDELMLRCDTNSVNL
mgnify:CR=1 FL=1